MFVETMMRYRREGRYSLHKFVLMPDHFHGLVTPAADVALERAVQLMKGGSSRALGAALQLRFPVWQRGFSDHRIRDVGDWETHVRYIHRNPVKAGLAAAAEGYAWSSASGQWEMDGVPQRLKPL